MAEIKYCEWCGEAGFVGDDIFHHMTLKEKNNCLERKNNERMATDRNVCVNHNVVDDVDTN